MAWRNLEFSPHSALMTMARSDTEWPTPDGELTLVQAMELLECVDSTLNGVVEEEAANGLLDDVGRRLRNLDHMHETGSNRCIQLGHNALIDLQPFDVVPHVLDIDGAVDMVDQPKLVKSGIEEGAPSRERRVAVVECERMFTCCMTEMVTVVGGLLPKGFWELAMEEAGLDAMSRGGAEVGRIGSKKADTIQEKNPPYLH
jgi:hypothetical protein